MLCTVRTRSIARSWRVVTMRRAADSSASERVPRVAIALVAEWACRQVVSKRGRPMRRRKAIRNKKGQEEEARERAASTSDQKMYCWT